MGECETRTSRNGTSQQRRVIIFDMSGRKRMEMISRLAIRKNWLPVHWFGSLEKQESHIRARFPDVVYHSKRNVIRRIFPTSVPHTYWPRRDVNVIRHLAIYDPVLYPVFLREAQNPYGMDQIAEYYEVITTWYYFFEYVNPDLVVFGNVPAHVYDYLIYLLCNERGIPTLLLLRHHHVPGVIMPTNRFEVAPPRIATSYNNLIKNNTYTNIKLDNLWQQYYQRMTGDYEKSMYASFSRRYEIDGKSERLILRDTIVKKIYDVITGKKSIFYGRALISEMISLPRRWLLRRSYENKTLDPDYNTPYVFVPLHVQPERTSVPQGDIFGHQLLMIEILSSVIPDSWKLYVKEHPVQLYDRPAYKFFRTPAFYKEILKYKNVQLVPSRITARKLIDNSKIVAGVTSTTCWEALFRGKPVILFGHVWFKFSEGVFHVQDISSCKKALNKIHGGYTIDQDKLRACLYAIQCESIPPAPNPDQKDIKSERDWEVWTDNISSQIAPDGNVIMANITTSLRQVYN